MISTRCFAPRRPPLCFIVRNIRANTQEATLETGAEDGTVVYPMLLLHTRTHESDFTLVLHRSALVDPRGG